MRAVNLLPRETGSKKPKFDRALVGGFSSSVLVAAILAGGFFLEKAHAANARQQLAEVQTELTQAQNKQPTTHTHGPATLQLPAVLAQQQPWQTALDSALSTRVAWDVLLRQLAYVVPDRITLTSVSLGGAGGTPGSASGTITLGGNAFSSDDIAVFLAMLARVPKVSQVNLVSNATNVGTPVQNFQITAQMSLPVALTAPPATDTTTTTGG